jgi:hypothetical protein
VERQERCLEHPGKNSGKNTGKSDRVLRDGPVIA